MKINIASGFDRLFLIVVVLVSSLGLTTCASKKEPVSTNDQLLISATPPFSTKEPDRYRALRTLTTTEAGSESRLTKTLIVRDGRMRREEFESTPEQKIILIEIPAGRFVLLPAAKLVASLDAFAEAGIQAGSQQASDDDLSTERLLNEVAVETRYQKLGPETVNGRTTTKYRVVPVPITGTASNSETLIWIDDALSMPIKWETTVNSGENHKKTIMELSEISSDVDARAFELPNDYRKVDIRSLYGWIDKNPASDSKAGKQ